MDVVGLSARIKELSLAEQISIIRDLGVRYVEIVAEIFWNLPDDRGLWSDIKSCVEKSGLVPILHASYIELNPASIKREISLAALKQYLKCLELAEFIGAIYMVVHPGNLNRNYPKTLLETAQNRLIDCLQELCKKAEETGTIIGLENGWNGENYPTIDSAKIHNYIMEMVSSPVLKAVVDIGHVNTFGIDIMNYIDTVKPNLVGLHLHDNLGTKDQHLPPGMGSIDREVFIKSLKQNVPAIIEVNSVRDMKLSLDFLFASFRALNRENFT